MNSAQLIICQSVSISKEIKKSTCPNCKINTRFLVETFEWYPTRWTCLNCGDAIEDNELVQRPFERGWRQKNITSALSKYKEFNKKKKVKKVRIK